jgi:hypothetical protein
MAIILNDNLSIQAPKASDSRFGPYADTATALTSVILANRYQGLIVGVITGGQVVEYWFRDGTADVNLILKVDNTGNTANIVAQSAYAFANTVNVFTQSAYTQANAANVLAQSAFNAANAAGSSALTQAAFNKANSANVLAQSAYDSSNSVYSFSQASYNQANASNVLAQAAFNSSNSVGVFTQSAYNVANAAYVYVSNDNPYTQSAYAKANSANVLAQSSYDFSNTVNVFTESSFNQANSANVLAQSAYNFANTINVFTQSSYNQANSANVLAQAAFNKANTGSSLVGLLANSVIFANSTGYTSNVSALSFTTSNNTLIVANITVPTIYTTSGGIVFPDGTSQTTAGVATDAYARITANAAFDKANSANVLAQAAFNKANTGGGTGGTFVISFSPYSDYGWIGDPIVPVIYDYGTL